MLLGFEDDVLDARRRRRPARRVPLPAQFTWALPPLPHGPDLLVLATELAGVGGPDLPLEVSAIDSFPSVTDARRAQPHRSSPSVAGLAGPGVRRRGALCDTLDRCLAVSQYLLDQRQPGSATPPELPLPDSSLVVTLPAWPPPVATALAPPVPPPPPHSMRHHNGVRGRGSSVRSGSSRSRCTVGLTLLAVRDRHHYPKAWDAKIAPIVAFVEEHRGLTYTHAVPVEYLPDKEFEALVTGQDSEVADPSDADSEASLRALGLIAGDTKLQQDSTKIQSSGVLAFYSDQDEKVVVRGTGALEAAPA